MNRFFPSRRNFHSLSVTDLVEAREAYHVHLTNLVNVVATAIGLYRIRVDDPDADDPDSARPRSNAPVRTLRNTMIRRWSWPCVLVFVTEWATEEQLHATPDQVVPRFLYLPDGRIVPTCVIHVTPEVDAPPPLLNLTFPVDLVGGGYPLVTDVQGQQHIGSIGCLVTDGDAVYALTNRHVTGLVDDDGAPPREIFTFVRGKRYRLGVADRKQLGKEPFSQVYAKWPAIRAQLNLDAGLIRIDDSSYWTAQVFGIGELDDLVDLHADTLSLDLIGCPVRAFGGASGELVGEIQALFYRYKSLGGFDYVSDFLIGPRNAQTPLRTHPGDSGTVWFFDPPLARANGQPAPRTRRYRPLGLQWGGQRILASQGEHALQFALATSLSTICRELDVDVVRDWNIGHPEYWGKTGHYKIAASACGLVTDPKLKTLLANNVEVIAFTDSDIVAGNLPKMNQQQFVALADVPDLVWRSKRPLDEFNHFADMDEPGKGAFKNTTLLKLCENPDNVAVSVWNDFYASFNRPPKEDKRGALPFRVWEIYNDMVAFVRAGKVADYVCAAGVLAHYVGDACQPLHVSRLHHGRSAAESAVHSKYETEMLDRFAADLIAGINTRLKNKSAKPTVKGGHAAAIAVVELMRRTIQQLPPLSVINAFNAADGTQRLPKMFQTLGARTIACMADGALTLATLWASAWKQGNGGKIAAAQLKTVDRAALQKKYNTPSFLKSRRLPAMTDLK
jgi:hypothetical protein